jgi:hypothetical protein
MIRTTSTIGAALLALAAAGCSDDEGGLDRADARATIDASSNVDAPVADAATVDAPDIPDADPSAPDAELADAAPATDGLVIISEVLYDPTGTNDGNQWVEVENADSMPIDIGGWRLCGASFQYWTLPQNILLQPGERILVHWSTDGTNGTPAGHYYTGDLTVNELGDDAAGTDQSIALYHHSGSFESSAAVRDFVQWEAGDQARSTEANGAGEWADPSGDFVADTGQGTSICWNGGATDAATGFAADPSPTPLAANGTCD